MKVAVDRFEGDFAVVELPDKTFINVPKILFSSAKEGDVFSIIKDEEETAFNKKSIEELAEKLFN